jgi:hypothetical protein
VKILKDFQEKQIQTLTADSFVNFENDASVEALKLTARRLAEHTATIATAENLQPASLENLANNLWDKAEYVTRETERRRLREQSLSVNQRAAVEMSEILSKLFLTQTLKRFATYFDLESGASRSVYNTPEAITKTTNCKSKQKSKIARNKNKRGD